MKRSVAVNALLKCLFTAKVSKNLELGTEIVKLGIESHKPLDIVIHFKTTYLEDTIRIYFKDNYLTTTINGKQLLHLYVVRYISIEDETIVLKQLLNDMDQEEFFKRYPANKRALRQLLVDENIDIDESGNIYLATFDVCNGIFVESNPSLMWEQIFKISFVLAQLYGMICFETLYTKIEKERLLQQAPVSILEPLVEEPKEPEEQSLPIETQLNLLLLSLTKGQLDELLSCSGIKYTAYNRLDLIGELLSDIDRVTHNLELLGYFDDYFGTNPCCFNTLQAYLDTHQSLEALIDKNILAEALNEDPYIYTEHITEIPKEFEEQLSKVVATSTIDDITAIVTADFLPQIEEEQVPEKPDVITDEACIDYLTTLLTSQENDGQQDDPIKREILDTIRERLASKNI